MNMRMMYGTAMPGPRRPGPDLRRALDPSPRDSDPLPSVAEMLRMYKQLRAEFVTLQERVVLLEEDKDKKKKRRNKRRSDG